jgi:hypothetical protein
MGAGADFSPKLWFLSKSAVFEQATEFKTCCRGQLWVPVKRFVPICKRSQNSEPAVGCSLRVPFPLSLPVFQTNHLPNSYKG